MVPQFRAPPARAIPAQAGSPYGPSGGWSTQRNPPLRDLAHEGPPARTAILSSARAVSSNLPDPVLSLGWASPQRMGLADFTRGC